MKRVMRPTPGTWPLAAVVAAAVVLGAGTGALQWQVRSQRDSDEARQQSVQAARDTTAAILSYTADNVDKDLGARTGRLTGAFLDEYTTLMNTQVIPGAKQDRMSAVAEVPAASAVSVTPNRAVTLLFVDQTITKPVPDGPAAPARSAFSVRVTLEKSGERWLVSGFEPV